jgi:hypothetical protein
VAVRQDVAPPAGYQPLVSYDNTSHAGFREFLKNRLAVEQFKSAPAAPRQPAGRRIRRR